jgi:hypothetical protein
VKAATMLCHCYFYAMELARKLRLKTDSYVWAINAPAHLPRLLPGIGIQAHAPGQKPAGQMMLFVYNSTELNQHLPLLLDYTGPSTLLWICYPKKSGHIPSDLIRMNTWQTLFDAGFRGQTSVAVDEDWSALRVTNAPLKNPTVASLPVAERQVEGIDFVNRTTTLPPDVLAALQPVPGLTAFFEGMSFSHRKEYLMAIADAKKPETRTRRIDSMVQQLLKMRTEKEMKTIARGQGSGLRP